MDKVPRTCFSLSCVLLLLVLILYLLRVLLYQSECVRVFPFSIVSKFSQHKWRRGKAPERESVWVQMAAGKAPERESVRVQMAAGKALEREGVRVQMAAGEGSGT